MKLPRCQQKGTLRHDATLVLIWELSSGRMIRYLCDHHAKTAFPQPDHISKLIDCLPNSTALQED
ncbi:MAG TPA: hypothetical protein VNH65_01130 [Candidatus Acidoferrum sp.]|nr:hypothetical protein [Candidatus Acidoferrum sp.]